jgi:signal peptidase I
MIAARKDAGAASSRKRKERPRKEIRSSWLWLRENLEAICVAFVLALIIRHFSIEAFKIPTGSMQPTLYGDARSGDRILVFKPWYLDSGPERWDIIVFRYPLNTSINYIKRCIGLPGESIRIQNGDIYVDGEIAGKPASVQESLWDNWPVYPRPGFEGPVETVWTRMPEGAFIRSGDEIVAEAEGEAALLYPDPITLRATAGQFPRTPANFAREGDVPLLDVRLSIEARIESENATIFADLHTSDHVFRLEIAPGEPPRVLHGIATGNTPSYEATDFRELGRADGPEIRAGSRYRIGFAYLDGSIRLAIDGEDRLESAFAVPAPRRVRHPVRFGVRRGKATFSAVRVERDLYHLATGVSTNVTVPPGHYFALGDNTAQSADSRRWMETTIRDREGREYRFDNESKSLRRDERALVFPDVFGQERRVESYTVEGSPRAAPFVPAEYVVGKAFFIFWPLVRDGALNMGFVH